MDIRAYIESGVIESYVLGMADSQEAAELEQLSREHPAIRKAMDDFERALEQQALAGATQPSPAVKEKLMATLNFRAEQTGTARVVTLTRSRYIAAAAIVLLIASAGLNFYFYSQFRSTRKAYQALAAEKNTLTASNQAMEAKALDMYNDMQMMSDPSIIKVTMKGDGLPGKEGNLVTVFWDGRSKDVYLLPNKLPQAPQGSQYQLWAIVDGKPVDAGMIADCTGLCKMKNIPKSSMFAITLEPAGGSPAPHLDRMFVAGKVG